MNKDGNSPMERERRIDQQDTNVGPRKNLIRQESNPCPPRKEGQALYPMSYKNSWNN